MIPYRGILCQIERGEINVMKTIKSTDVLLLMLAYFLQYTYEKRGIYRAIIAADNSIIIVCGGFVLVE